MKKMLFLPVLLLCSFFVRAQNYTTLTIENMLSSSIDVDFHMEDGGCGGSNACGSTITIPAGSQTMTYDYTNYVPQYGPAPSSTYEFTTVRYRGCTTSLSAVDACGTFGTTNTFTDCGSTTNITISWTQGATPNDAIVTIQ